MPSYLSGGSESEDGSVAEVQQRGCVAARGCQGWKHIQDRARPGGQVKIAQQIIAG